MKAKLRTIGVLAKDVGVSVETIRYYQRRGLIITPERVDGRYRHYSDEILAQLRYILIAKSLGMSLKDIEKLRGSRRRLQAFRGGKSRSHRFLREIIVV